MSTYFSTPNYEEELAKNRLLENQLRGSQSMQMPQVGSAAAPSYEPNYDIGARAINSKIQAQGQQGAQEAQMAGALSAGSMGAGMAAGGPVGAGIAVGGQLLAQYMANQAQAEQAKRQRAMEIAQQHSAGERQGIDQMLSAWRGALR